MDRQYIVSIPEYHRADSYHRYSKRSEYDTQANSTNTLISEDTFHVVLPTDADIFADLPDYVYDNARTKAFLASLRRQIIRYRKDLNGITLSKLKVSEHTDNTLVIEWIFNFFRFLYVFDNVSGDYHGVIINDTDTDSFKNDITTLKPDKYDSISEADLMYAVMMS